MAKVKICGLRRMEDVEIINQLLPDYVGFVFAPSKRQITREQAMKLHKYLNEQVSSVGVFVNEDRNRIIDYLDSGIIHLAQLHGNESEDDIIYIKQHTKKSVIKAVSVTSREDILRWKDSSADYLLFDHGAGGSGKTFAWEELRACQGGRKPFFLAGGINQDNIMEALELQPYGIDVSSGVETNGYKDEQKIMKLITSIRTSVVNERSHLCQKEDLGFMEDSTFQRP